MEKFNLRFLIFRSNLPGIRRNGRRHLLPRDTGRRRVVNPDVGRVLNQLVRLGMEKRLAEVVQPELLHPASRYVIDDVSEQIRVHVLHRSGHAGGTGAHWTLEVALVGQLHM